MTLLEGAQHFLVITVKHFLEICTNFVFAELKFLVTDNFTGMGYPAYIFVMHMEAFLHIFLHPLYFSVFSECDIFYLYLFHTLVSMA